MKKILQPLLVLALSALPAFATTIEISPTTFDFGFALAGGIFDLNTCKGGNANNMTEIWRLVSLSNLRRFDKLNDRRFYEKAIHEIQKYK